MWSGTEYLQGFTDLLKAHTKQATAEMTPHSDINIVPHKKPYAIKSELEFGPVSQSQNFISSSVVFFFFSCGTLVNYASLSEEGDELAKNTPLRIHTS